MSNPHWFRIFVFVLAILLASGRSIIAQTDSAASTTAKQSSSEKTASESQTQYDVASVRQNLTPQPRWRMSFTTDGVDAVDVTLLYAIQDAYGVYDRELWSGIPSWTEEKRFDIKAKYDLKKYPHTTIEQRRAMLQQLLAERFKLVIHHETEQFPIYRIEIAKGGQKFTETKTENLHVSPVYGPMCSHIRSRPGVQEMQGCTMDQLANDLTGWTHEELGRQIVDQTGLSGRYNFTLNWTPTSNGVSESTSPGSGRRSSPRYENNSACS